MMPWIVRAAAACLIAALAAACGDRSAPVAEAVPNEAGPSRRPNIVWMVADALAPPFGQQVAEFAAQGVAYGAAVPTPASAAMTRAALLTGVDPEMLGLGAAGLASPPAMGIRVVPERLRRAGYYTTRSGPRLHNLSASAAGDGDAALAQPGLLGAWDAAGPDADWRGRRKDWDYPCTVSFGCGGPPHDPERPFFATFNLTASGASLDAEVGGVLAALAEGGLERSTAVFLIGSTGDAPVIVRWPPGTGNRAADDRLVKVVDLAPTALALAGAPVPMYMMGRPLLEPGTRESETRDSGTKEVAVHGAAAPPTAASPAGYPTGGLFHVAPRVELGCATGESTIVYTTEREAPFHWRLYTGPFRMRFWTLRMQCGRLGYRDSEVVRYEFDIE